MTGHIQLFENKPFPFKGLTRVTGRVRGARFPKHAAWKIKSLKAPDVWHEEDNVIYLTKEEDEDGNPYLVLDWTEGPGCHSSFDGISIASRRPKGHDQDRDNLGIGWTEKEVEEQVDTSSEDDGQEDKKGKEPSGGQESTCPFRYKLQERPSIIPEQYAEMDYEGSEQAKFWNTEEERIYEGAVSHALFLRIQAVH